MYIHMLQSKCPVLIFNFMIFICLNILYTTTVPLFWVSYFLTNMRRNKHFTKNHFRIDQTGTRNQQKHNFCISKCEWLNDLMWATWLWCVNSCFTSPTDAAFYVKETSWLHLLLTPNRRCVTLLLVVVLKSTSSQSTNLLPNWSRS